MRVTNVAERRLPGWVPSAVRLYLDHTEEGLSLRALARREGCHASTVMRLVRRYENRRDDPLMDEALAHLGRVHAARTRIREAEDTPDMSIEPRAERLFSPRLRAEPGAGVRAGAGPSGAADRLLRDEAALAREARRILRRMAEPGAVLAIAPDMEKAVVLRGAADGQAVRTGVVDCAVAQAFALKDWIRCPKPGRVSSYTITAAGRAALKRHLEEEGAGGRDGFAEQHRQWEEREIDLAEEGPRRLKVNVAESPVTALARRRDRDGRPFLAPELVAAAERLREDFELAQMGPRVTQNWDRFLTAGDRGGAGSGRGPAEGPRAARERVAAALRDLGPGLGDMALRCCCFLEGLEAAEKRLGWSARSGKIVLRIALMRLKRHYEETGGAPLIG